MIGRATAITAASEASATMSLWASMNRDQRTQKPRVASGRACRPVAWALRSRLDRARGPRKPSMAGRNVMAVAMVSATAMAAETDTP